MCCNPRWTNPTLVAQGRVYVFWRWLWVDVVSPDQSAGYPISIPRESQRLQRTSPCADVKTSDRLTGHPTIISGKSQHLLKYPMWVNAVSRGQQTPRPSESQLHLRTSLCVNFETSCHPVHSPTRHLGKRERLTKTYLCVHVVTPGQSAQNSNSSPREWQLLLKFSLWGNAMSTGQRPKASERINFIWEPLRVWMLWPLVNRTAAPPEGLGWLTYSEDLFVRWSYNLRSIGPSLHQ